MTSLRLDKNNNLLFVRDFEVVDSTECLQQDIKNMLSLFKKEYPFNERIGLDWLDLMQNGNIEQVKNVIIDAINEDGRVDFVKNININFENGKIDFDIEIQAGGENVNI